MAGLVIKNLPDQIHQKLKEQAERHHRSMTKEAIALLELGLERSQFDRVLELPAPYRGAFPLRDEYIDEAKRKGRE